MTNTNTTLYIVAFFHGGDYEMEHDIIGIYSDEALAEKAIYEIVENAVAAKSYLLKYDTYFKFFIIPRTLNCTCTDLYDLTDLAFDNPAVKEFDFSETIRNMVGG